MSSTPESRSLHERAAASAKETRSTLVTLSTASIAGLFALVSRAIEPALTVAEIPLVLATIAAMVATLASAIWFGFCDAQWSYWWGVELDPDRQRQEVESAVREKKIWHTRKSLAERAMLLFFVAGAIAGGVFVVIRVLHNA